VSRSAPEVSDRHRAASVVARRAGIFTESVIREMTRLAREANAINLAQGFPDFPMPPSMKEAACAAIVSDINQYAITWGSTSLRRAIAEKYQRVYGMTVDPEREITVTCGATEAMAATFLALIDPGDEVIIFAPFYENYGPDAILADARPVWVHLQPPSWSIDWAALERAFTSRTRALVLNTPHNPTGRVFTREEVTRIAELCESHGVIVVTDEPYEHIVYEGAHNVIATWPRMYERSVTISSLSKTFSCTGWRLGYAIAEPRRTDAIRKVHDFLTVGAPAPLQRAAVAGFALGADYYAALVGGYRERRGILAAALADGGFIFTLPEGAYYILADFTALSDADDRKFAEWLARECGVAAVPGSSFYPDKETGAGRRCVRFAFCKQRETLERAAERLARVASRV